MNAPKTAGWLLIGLLVLPLAVRADVVEYLHTDLQGSVVAVTDETGAIIERRVHEPYGLPQAPIADGPGYTGHDMDGETGLVYMQQRYYDPEVGRFLSVDPDPVNTTTAHNFGRYHYAANNPYKYRDPDGRAVDIVLDIGFIGYSAYTLATDPSWTNAAALGADIVGAALPGVTGLGVAVRGVGAGADVGRASKIDVATESVQRAMSRAELRATEKTGLVRGGRDGTHHVSDAISSDAKRARSRLALPNEPEVRVTMEVPKGSFGAPSKVQPLDKGSGKALPGGGTERTASGPVPAKVTKVDPYDR